MPNVLSELDLQSLAGIVADLTFRDTCDILRLTRGLDTEGGGPDNYTPIAGGPFPCSVINAKPKLARVYEEQLETRVYKSILLPRGMIVLGDDHLRVTSTENNVTRVLVYRVIGLYSPQSFQPYTQVDVEYDASLV
jgi:hypothetical protein